MAGPAKKPRNTVQPKSSNEDSAGSESEEYQGQEEIEATFEGRNPDQGDYHGIKQLLQQLFLKSHVDLSQMTDMLIGTKVCGTVLHQCLDDGDDDDDDDQNMEDDSNIFGITTVVNLSSNKKMSCVQQFFSLLDELAKKHADKSSFEAIERLVDGNNRLGFLVNERFLNIPAKVSIHMLKSLQDDLDKAKRKDPSYDFTHLFMICKTCKSKDNKDVTYLNEEEQIFTADADLSFEFSVADESDTGLGGKWGSEDEQMIPFRKVIIFKADKLPSIINKVETYVQA